MSKRRPVRERIMAALGSGRPRSLREIVKATGLGNPSVSRALYDYWKAGILLRTEKPAFEASSSFRGRAGVRKNTRSFHLYLPRPEGKKKVRISGRNFVAYARRYLDRRGAREKSKAKLILEFLRRNRGRALYSKEIAQKLRERGVKPCDIMPTARRYERKGMVYIRGYRTHDRQTPFNCLFPRIEIESRRIFGGF